jgi:hypothetical protein
MTVNRTVTYPDIRAEDVNSGLSLATQFTEPTGSGSTALDPITSSVKPLLLAVFSNSLKLKSSAIDWHGHKQVLDLIYPLGRPHFTFNCPAQK